MHPVLEDFVLGGERVLLRPHVPEDAPRAFELLHERDSILRWLIWAGPRDVGELEEYYRSWRVGTDEADDYTLAVCRREDEILVGSVGLRFLGHPGSGDVGYWIGEPYWNKGYASEAVRLAAYLAFRYLEADTLTSWVFEGNDASRRVLEKSGFRHVRTATRKHAGREPRPEWSLAFLRGEWEARERAWIPARAEVSLVG